MTLSDKSSKLILSTALFTLAGSIVFVSGTGLAQGATSTDKAISTLKSQIKSLQARVQTLEDSPELLQGEPGPEGPQGAQGDRGATGATGATGTMSGLRTKSIKVWEQSYGDYCSSFSGFTALNSKTSITSGGASNTISLDKSCSTLSSSSVTVYVP